MALKHGLTRFRRTATRAATRMLTSRAYDLRSTIIVAGSPRSGTTWVGNTVASIPGSAVVFEPLHLDRVPLAREAGFTWRTYVRQGTRWPAGEHALDEMLHGRVLNDWTAREIPYPKRVTTWIVKCIRMNRMLPWLTERFATRAPLLVIRHPCAVIASQMAAGWARPTEHPDPALVADFPQTRSVLETLETDEEHRAAGWALDTLVPLSAAKPHPWVTLLYERVTRGPEELDTAFQRWGITRPPGLNERMRVLSSTTTPSRNAARFSPLTGWTKQLSHDQIRRILAVTHALGLDFYGEDTEPDESRLGRWGLSI
jgi:hypothetical protein